MERRHSTASESSTDSNHTRQSCCENVDTSAVGRISKVTTPKPRANALQFVKTGPCDLYRSAQEQLKKVEELKKAKKKIPDEAEDWQSNLDNWKVSRRKRQEHIIERVVEVKKYELEEHERNRRRSKTFSEMIQDRNTRGRKTSLPVYQDEEVNDLSDLGLGHAYAQHQTNGYEKENKGEEKFELGNEQEKENKAKETQSEVNGHKKTNGFKKNEIEEETEEEYTYERAIQSYVNFAETRVKSKSLRSISGDDEALFGGRARKAISTTELDKKVDCARVDVSKRKAMFEEAERRAREEEKKEPLRRDVTLNSQSIKERLSKLEEAKQEAMQPPEKRNHYRSMDSLDTEDGSRRLERGASLEELDDLPGSCLSGDTDREDSGIHTGDVSSCVSQADESDHVPIPEEARGDNLGSFQPLVSSKMENGLDATSNSIADSTVVENFNSTDTALNREVKPVERLRNKLFEAGGLETPSESLFTECPQKPELELVDYRRSYHEGCPPHDYLGTGAPDMGARSSCDEDHSRKLEPTPVERPRRNNLIGVGDVEDQRNYQVRCPPVDYHGKGPRESRRIYQDHSRQAEPPLVERPLRNNLPEVGDIENRNYQELSLNYRGNGTADVESRRTFQEDFSRKMTEPTPVERPSRNNLLEVGEIKDRKSYQEPSSEFAPLKSEPSSGDHLRKGDMEKKKLNGSEEIGNVRKMTSGPFDCAGLVSADYHCKSSVVETLMVRAEEALRPPSAPKEEGPPPLFMPPHIGSDGPGVIGVFEPSPTALEPPKEKPPPPPVDLEDQAPNKVSLRRLDSTKRIKKEIRQKRSSFLGIEGNSDDSYLDPEVEVRRPPDMTVLLAEERRLDREMYRQSVCSESDSTQESRDSGVELDVKPGADLLPGVWSHSSNDSETFGNQSTTSEEDEIMRKEREIIEALEQEERIRKQDLGEKLALRLRQLEVEKGREEWVRLQRDDSALQHGCTHLTPSQLVHPPQEVYRRASKPGQVSDTVPRHDSWYMARAPPHQESPSHHHHGGEYRKSMQDMLTVEADKRKSSAVRRSMPDLKEETTPLRPPPPLLPPKPPHHHHPNGGGQQMSRQTLHALSAAPRSRIISNETWQAKKKPNYNYQHWLIQEAEHRRLVEREWGYQHVPTCTVPVPPPWHGNRDPPRPLPDAIIQSLTQRVQARINTTPPDTNNNRRRLEGPVDSDQEKMLSVSGKKRCSHCTQELGRGAAMIIESLRLFYHIDCFKCCVCCMQLGDGLMGTDVRVRNNKLHCHNCYSSDDGVKFSCV